MGTPSIKDRIRKAASSPGGTATRPVQLWLAPDMGLVERHQQAVADRDAARAAHNPDEPPPSASLDDPTPHLTALQERVDQLRAQLDEHLLTITVRALSDDEWQCLVDEHPPRRATDGDTDGDTAAGDTRDAASGWNTSTFPPALLRAGTIAPDLDDEDWATLLGGDGRRPVLTRIQIDDAAGAVAALSRFRLDIPFS